MDGPLWGKYSVVRIPAGTCIQISNYMLSYDKLMINRDSWITKLIFNSRYDFGGMWSINSAYLKIFIRYTGR